METFDVLIVGGGPTGLACAIECLRRGLSYVVLEKGCLVQSLVNYPVNMLFFTTVELLEIGDVPMTAGRDKPTRVETLKYYRRVAQYYGLRVRQYEVAQLVRAPMATSRSARVPAPARIAATAARKLVLAAGNYGQPNLLGIPASSWKRSPTTTGKPTPTTTATSPSLAERTRRPKPPWSSTGTAPVSH